MDVQSAVRVAQGDSIVLRRGLGPRRERTFLAHADGGGSDGGATARKRDAGGTLGSACARHCAAHMPHLVPRHRRMRPTVATCMRRFCTGRPSPCSLLWRAWADCAAASCGGRRRGGCERVQVQRELDAVRSQLAAAKAEGTAAKAEAAAAQRSVVRRALCRVPTEGVCRIAC